MAHAPSLALLVCDSGLRRGFHRVGIPGDRSGGRAFFRGAIFRRYNGLARPGTALAPLENNRRDVGASPQHPTGRNPRNQEARERPAADAEHPTSGETPC